MKKSDLNTQELKWLLTQQEITIKPTYMHDDYITTPFRMPYPVKDKLDRIAKKNGLSRSRIIQMLIEVCPEDGLAEYLGYL